MGKILFFVFSSILVFVITVFFRVGGHKSANLQVETRDAFSLLYKEHRGPYHKINDVIIEVETLAAKISLPCNVTFGEYLNDPRTMEERHLRSHGGCVLTQALTNVPEGYSQKTVPAKTWLVARFHGAPAISPFKVYPKVEEWFRSQRKMRPTESLELYKSTQAKSSETEYLFALD